MYLTSIDTTYYDRNPDGEYLVREELSFIDSNVKIISNKIYFRFGLASKFREDNIDLLIVMKERNFMYLTTYSIVVNRKEDPSLENLSRVNVLEKSDIPFLPDIKYSYYLDEQQINMFAELYELE